jgi:hypothetical protein
VSYLVRKDVPNSQSAWLSLYAQGSAVVTQEPDDPVFNTNKAKAAPFDLKMSATLWAWSTDGVVEDLDEKS